MLRIALGLTLLALATTARAFDGERPALPEDYGLSATYQHLRCPEVPGRALNAMAYVRLNPTGQIELLQFCIHKWDDWLAPDQDPRLFDFEQCWMRPPVDREGGTSTWCQEIVMPDGRVLWPAGTGQIYAWVDARTGKLRRFCDMSCHWPGDLD